MLSVLSETKDVLHFLALNKLAAARCQQSAELQPAHLSNPALLNHTAHHFTCPLIVPNNFEQPKTTWNQGKL